MPGISLSLHIPDESCSIDTSTATVRDHIEKVVETLVGEDLDSVNIIRLSRDPDCKTHFKGGLQIDSYSLPFCVSPDERLFLEYHQKLSDSLSQLVYSIRLVIESESGLV